MKRSLRNILFVAALSAVFFASCKKDYHCQCSFNNHVVLNKDLGAQYSNNATNECNSYDSTVAGEVWNCTLY